MAVKFFNILLLALFTVCFFTVMSCSEKERDMPPPPGILSEEEFTDLMFDMALAESVVNINIKGASYPKFDSVYPFDPLRENRVRVSQFDSTLRYYIRSPDTFKKIQAGVVERLTEMQAARDTVRKTPDQR